MKNIEVAIADVVLDSIGEMQADRDAGDGPVHGDGERAPDPDEVAVAFRELLVRAGRKDGDVMAASPQTGGEVTHVLGDPARMCVVIGRNEADLHERLPLTCPSLGRKLEQRTVPCGPSCDRCGGTSAGRCAGASRNPSTPRTPSSGSPAAPSSDPGRPCRGTWCIRCRFPGGGGCRSSRLRAGETGSC